MKPKDLTGMRFGHLVAEEMLDKDDPKCKPSNCGSRQWLCKCDCGNDHIVFAKDLIHGHTKSCGCQKYANRNYSKFKRIGPDLTGRRYGHLTVMGKAPKEYRPSYTQVWTCLCDCENETFASTHQLVKGLKTTCGKNTCAFHNQLIHSHRPKSQKRSS